MKKEESPKPEASEEPKIDYTDVLARMEARMTELEDRLETSDAENNVLEETISDLRMQFEHEGYTEEPEAEVLYDPYYSKRPHQIIGEIEPDQNHPEGQVLGWKNQTHREGRRGWRGWIPLAYGDQYAGKNGNLLSKYIVDPPPRIEGSTKMDNYVRRTDSVLCRLDKRIFDARQTRRQTRSASATATAGSSRTQVLGDGVEVTGPGLRDQDRPAGGFRRGEKVIVGEHHQKFPVKPLVKPPAKPEDK